GIELQTLEAVIDGNQRGAATAHQLSGGKVERQFESDVTNVGDAVAGVASCGARWRKRAAFARSSGVRELIAKVAGRRQWWTGHGSCSLSYVSRRAKPLTGLTLACRVGCDVACAIDVCRAAHQCLAIDRDHGRAVAVGGARRAGGGAWWRD